MGENKLKEIAENMDLDSIDEENPDFDIEEFISENYKIHTVMGVFGAISMYLAQLTTTLNGVNENVTKIGIVTSFALFILTSLPIFSKLWAELDHDLLSFPANTNKPQFLLILFSISFSLLTITISYMALSISGAVVFFVSFITLYFGWLSFTPILNSIPVPEREFGSLIDNVVYNFAIYLIKNMIVSLFASIVPILIISYIIIDSELTNMGALINIILLTDQVSWFVTPVLAFFFGIGIAGTISLMGVIIFVGGVFK